MKHNLGIFQPNNFYCGQSEELLGQLPDCSIDLTITSPPYDICEMVNGRVDDSIITKSKKGQRDYNGYSWDFVTIAKQLYRVTKDGGVVVWVVGDTTIDYAESGTPEIQKLYFQSLGFICETMLFSRKSAFPPTSSATKTYVRYCQDFEYMYVFSKGKMKTFNPICDVKNKNAGKKVFSTERNKDGTMRVSKAKEENRTYKEHGIRSNIWHYQTGYCKSGDKIMHEHPATFPEKLAEDHILSWSNPGDIVLDIFSGSGTTAKKAYQNHRDYLGFDCSQEYIDLSIQRLNNTTKKLFV